MKLIIIVIKQTNTKNKALYSTVYLNAQGKETQKETTKLFWVWALHKIEIDLFTFGYNIIFILLTFFKSRFKVKQANKKIP